MANINSVVLSGTIVQAEPRINASGKVLDQTIVANMWDGEKEHGHFFNFKLLGEKRVNTLKSMLVKGAKVVIKGRLAQETWTKDGENKSRVVIVAEDIEITKFSGDKPSADSSENTTESTLEEAEIDMSEIPF